jgi:membrane protease subunit (stomatin/prohibitin family)
MFIGRRRPLLRAAMIGGAGYAAGRAGQRASYREQDQEARLGQLETQQPAAQATQAAAPAPAQAAGGTDLVSRLKELSELQSSGALTQEEFNAAKAKLLAG